MTTNTLNIDTVEGEMSFAVDTGRKPATYPTELDPETGSARYTGVFETKHIALRNGRWHSDKLNLDQHGFVLRDHRSAVTDFFNDSQIRNTYYGECADLLKEITGVHKVAIFDHTIRIEDANKRNSANTYRAPVRSVHNDYTDWSAPKRVRDILTPNEAEERLKNRYVMVNVWRPLMEPVVSWPLVLCDASTLGHEDMIAADHIYPDRRGETYRTAFSEGQEWYYFPEMTMSEVALIKCFDSETDGRARYSAHGAADLIDPPPLGSRPRESIEVRTIGFFNS